MENECRLKKDGLHDWKDKLASFFGDRNSIEKIIILIIIFSILYGACISLTLSVWATDPMNYPDLSFYQERTTSVLAGEIPYRDLQVESPPLIIYLMVPAQLMGGELIHYAAWFSIVTFAGAVCIYMLLRRFDENSAYLASVLYLIHPATVATASINVQDESLIAVLILISLAVLVRGMWKISLTLSFIGVAAKAFTIFMVPFILISNHDPVRIRRGIVLLSLLAVTIMTPFLLLAPEQFLAFPQYYISQALGGGVTDGMSLWRFLADLGIILPQSFYLIALVASYLMVIFLIHRFEPDHFASGYLVLLPFLLFFPKIYPYYFIMALAPLCVLGSKQFRIIWYSILIYLGSMATMPFVTLHNEPLFVGMGSWVPVIINLLLSALMIYTAAQIIKNGRKWTGNTEKDMTS